MTFQNSGCRGGTLLDWFHDYVCSYLVLVLILVGLLLGYISYNRWVVVGRGENIYLEFFWTLTPALLLVLIGVPRIYILYNHRVDTTIDLRLKITGHQWYWSYEYIDIPDSRFDSFIVPTSNLDIGSHRLLDTDNHVVIPIFTEVRLAVCSADVLHAWALPSIGLKVDAVPGRVNTLFFSSNISGLFFGQCSEICGANHSFIPITLEVSRFSIFKMLRTWR
jgi:cytochrome c oxidase subunit 2